MKIQTTCCNYFTYFKGFPWTFGTFLTIISWINGCGTHVHHVVEPGETLYSISWMYGYDYRTVAQWNDINAPYVLQAGQWLRVAPIAGEKENTTGQAKKSVTKSSGQSKDATAKVDKPHKTTKQAANTYKTWGNKKIVWSWPTEGGKVIQTFKSNDPGKMGLDIAGREGQSIYSASAGTVVYSGSGLPRYGKLIIVKHNETFLSAYAHNKKLLVNEGDVIKARQAIAKMGRTGTNRTKLHFEIRRNGKPVNPQHYLPKQTH